MGCVDMRLMRESLFLIIIGLADLLSTLLMVGMRHATEGNPLMAYYLQAGVGAFVMVKLCLLFFPVFIAEWSKKYKPQFVRVMMRGAIAVYLGSYVTLFLFVNVLPVADTNQHLQATPDAVIKVAENPR